MARRAEPGPAARSIRDEIERFLTHCRSRGLAPKTVDESYRVPLRRILLPWCEATGLDAVGDLGQEAPERFGAELNARQVRRRDGTVHPISPWPVRANVKAVRQFFGYEQLQRMAPVDRTHAQLPRKRRVLRDPLSRDDVRRLEQAAPTERNRLVIRVLADTGVREGGLVRLTAEDLLERDQGRRHFLRVRYQTGERLCPIEPALYRRLRAHATGKNGAQTRRVAE